MVNNILAIIQTHVGHTKHTLAWKNIPSKLSSSCGCERFVPCFSKKEGQIGVGRRACNTNLENRLKGVYYNVNKQFNSIPQHGRNGIEWIDNWFTN